MPDPSSFRRADPLPARPLTPLRLAGWLLDRNCELWLDLLFVLAKAFQRLRSCLAAAASVVAARAMVLPKNEPGIVVDRCPHRGAFTRSKWPENSSVSPVTCYESARQTTTHTCQSGLAHHRPEIDESGRYRLLEWHSILRLRAD